MAETNAEWFARIVTGLVLLFAAVFLMLVIASGQGIDVYTSTTDGYNETFPPWDVSGATFNGTNATNGDLTLDSSETGVYTYTSQIIEGDQLLQITDFEYSATIREDQGQGITVKVYTSDNGFLTISNVQTIQLSDGVGQRVVDLPREEDYRVQVRMDYSGSGTEPVLESLRLNGATFSRDYDFTILFEIITVWILTLSSLFAILPRN